MPPKICRMGAVALACALGTSQALALPPANDGASAQLFFERGRTAAAAGDAEAACKNFEESLRLEVAVGTLFNLAHCEEELGRVASAWQHLREGIDRLDPNDPRVAPARKAALALEPRLPRLQVQLEASAPPNVRVLRDGVPLSGLSLAEALPVNPGKHLVELDCEGYEAAKYEVVLREGESKVLPLALGRKLPSSPVASKGATVLRVGAEGQASSPLRTAAWIGVVAGGASLVTGLVTGALAFERSRVVAAHCDADHVCDSEGSAALSRSQLYGGISTVTMLAGAAVLGVGVVILLVTKPSATSVSSRGFELRF